MSLVGNLADLGLGDIFQIVSLSRRSGSLRLETPGESGEIVFVSGKVVAAERSRPPQTVGDVLLHMGVVTPLLYQEMLAHQARGLTGADLFKQFNLDTDSLDRALESLLTRIVYEMFEWEEGSFSFVLAQDPPLWTGFSLTAARVVLARGLNPQYLAIEGARIRDERQKQDPLESFLARGRAPRESSSQATAELSSALRAEPELEDVLADESPTPEQNIIPFPQGRRKLSDSDAPEVPPPARIMPPPTSQPNARGTTSVPDLVIPPDSVFATSPARAAALKQWQLVVVDDDVLTARLIADALTAKFAAVHIAHRVPEATELLAKLSGQPLVLAVDLIMPRSDGRGILGGVEVIAQLRQSDPVTPIIAFSDYKNEEAEARAKALGVMSFLAKPKKRDVAAPASRTPSDVMQAFLRTLVDATGSATREELAVPPPAPVGYRFTGPAPSEPPSVPLEAPPMAPFTVGELDVDVDDLVASADRDLGGPPPAVHIDLSNLRSMLAELIDPANRDTITLLVLRYASEVFERGGLFLATRRAFVGLGGFLNSEQSDAFVARVRRIQMPVEHDSVFAKVAQYRSAVRGPVSETEANRALLEGLGGWHGHPTVAIPIISGDRVAAILFGDNPSGKPLGATDSLEIFLQQAGLAMDRALLERRLEESKKNRQ